MSILKALTVIALLTVSNFSVAQWHYHKFQVMGTSAAIEFWETDPKRAEQLILLCVAEMERINLLMSTYVKDSEVSKINSEASTKPIKISDELFLLLQRAKQFSKLTNGAFDITYESVGFRYDYRNREAPDSAFIESNKNLIDYRQMVLSLKDKSVFFRQPGMKINLGGIAKGHAVDSVITVLMENQIENAFVQAGGDSRLLGDRRGRPWTIGIRHPRQQEQVLTRLPLTNSAVSTSGDYERFFVDNGRRIHHIIDPNTGRSANKSVSVSIIADDSLTADALSTSVFILGPEEGLKLVESTDNVSAIIIDNNGKFHYSSDLMAQ